MTSRVVNRLSVWAILVIAALSLGALALVTSQTIFADSAWTQAKKGSVSGKLTFSKQRPAQPIVVYLERKDDLAFDAPDKVKVAQKGAKFEPAFAVVTAGQTVEFVNDEEKEIDHNVYSPDAGGFDLGIFSRGATATYVFKKEHVGAVSLHCSVHKLMDGKLFVAPNPAFALVAGDGDSFSIKDVPEGTYTLKTYQRAKRFHEAEMEVKVEAGKDATVTVEFAR